MISIIIAGGLFIISAGVMSLILARRCAILPSMNTAVFSSEHMEQKKEDIIEMRLRRKFGTLKEGVKRKSSPFFSILGIFFSNFYKKVAELERQYQEKAHIASYTHASDRQKAQLLLEEARDVFAKEEYGVAEQKYIQVIGLNHKCVEAYQGLGKTYVARKDYEHALEAFQHAVKLDPSMSSAYYDLGMLYRELGDHEKEALYLKKACELDTKHPRYLNALIEAGISTGKRLVAWEALRKLKRANPENQKLEELEKRIDDMKR